MREATVVWAGEVILGTNPTSLNLLTTLGILSAIRRGMFWLRAIVVCPPSKKQLQWMHFHLDHHVLLEENKKS